MERGPHYPLGEFDGSKWAAEFMRLFGDHKDRIDEELMLGWFCNAIMTGFDEGSRRVAPTSPEEWIPSEVLYAFMGWLTARTERTPPFSATDDASPAVELIVEFCTRHKLAPPREGWARVIVSKA